MHNIYQENYPIASLLANGTLLETGLKWLYNASEHIKLDASIIVIEQKAKDRIPQNGSNHHSGTLGCDNVVGYYPKTIYVQS
jgi:hypothetical protein